MSTKFFRRALIAFLLLALLAQSASAQNCTAAPTAPKETPKMTWKAWVTVATVLTLLIVLFLELIPCSAVMFVATLFLRLVGIINTADFLAGLSNSGVATVGLLYVVIGPITGLAGIRYLVGKTMEGDGSVWPRFKICAAVMGTSWFVNNTPLVAMLTPLIKQHCRVTNTSPAQFLMSMNTATLIGGTFAVIGTSTNLIYDGLMQKTDMGPMPFFEMIKVSGIPALFALVYLCYAPLLLLPKTTGGMFRLVRDQGSQFIAQFVVDDDSPLVGAEARQVHNLLPPKIRQDVELVEVLRGTESFRPTGTETIRKEDVLVFSGKISSLQGSAAILKIAWVPLDLQAAPGDVVAPAPPDTIDDTAFAPPIVVNGSFHEPFPHAVAVPHDGEKRTDEFMEVVLSDKCPFIGSMGSTGNFQRKYDVSIVAIRTSSIRGEADLTGAKLQQHVLAVGDTLLLLGPARCLEQFPEHFYVASTIQANAPSMVAEHYITVPDWFCVGQYLGEENRTAASPAHSPLGSPRRNEIPPLPAVRNTTPTPIVKPTKVVRLPDQYPYLALLIFAAMMSSAIAGIDIVICACVAAVALITLKLMTLHEAFDAIDVDVYVMVAFSFGLGTAMTKSGLADVIGDLIIRANISGFPLLLLIAAITAIITNVVTNKACAQVMFPIVYTIYKLQGKNPLPPVILLACTTSVALCTPYGFATNLIIMGPGGYTAKDFIKFGVPLNIMLVVMFALATAIVYDDF